MTTGFASRGVQQVLECVYPRSARTLLVHITRIVGFLASKRPKDCVCLLGDIRVGGKKNLRIFFLVLILASWLISPLSFHLS